MRAEVRHFEWPDLEREGSAEFTLVVFAAGPIGGEGADLFQVEVCTPAGLTELIRQDGIVSGRHRLFTEHIRPATIEAFIQDRLRRIDGETWGEVAEKISRLGYWELEDYTGQR
jgi:hypothetical protein